MTSVPSPLQPLSGNKLRGFCLRVVCMAGVLLACAAHGPLTAQTHTVQPKETLYGIARQHGVDMNALLEANPAAEQGLQPGMVLVLPTAAAPVPSAPPALDPDARDSLARHPVAAGETLFSIASRYGVTVEALQAANPGLGTALRVGQLLRIPGTAAAPPSESVDASSVELAPRRPAADPTLNIVASLPFALHADTAAGGVPAESKVARLREVAMEMQQGLVWAAEVLGDAGVKVELEILDSEAVGGGWRPIPMGRLKAADAVVGPLQRDRLEVALKLSAGVRAEHWVMTPQPLNFGVSGGHARFTSEPLDRGMEALGRLTAQYHHRDRVLVLLTGGKDAALEQAFLRGFHEEARSTGATCDTLRVSERFASGLRESLSRTRLNVLVVPAGSPARSMLAQLQTELGRVSDLRIRLVVHPDVRDFEFIEPAFADRVRLTLPALAEPDWTSPAALATLPRYRAAYGTDPGPYARSAFDAVLATAALKGIVLPGTLVPWSHRYVWSPVTGGHVHTGWRMVELCHGRWEDVEEGCLTE